MRKFDFYCWALSMANECVCFCTVCVSHRMERWSASTLWRWQQESPSPSPQTRSDSSWQSHMTDRPKVRDTFTLYVLSRHQRQREAGQHVSTVLFHNRCELMMPFMSETCCWLQVRHHTDYKFHKWSWKQSCLPACPCTIFSFKNK